MLRRYTLLLVLVLCTTLAAEGQRRRRHGSSAAEAPPPPPPPPPPPGLMLFAQDAQLSPDGSKLAVLGSDRLLRILSFPSGELLKVITPNGGECQGVIYLTDSSLLTRSDDGSLQFWFERSAEPINLSFGAPIRMLVVSNSRRRLIAVGANNNMLLFHGDGSTGVRIQTERKVVSVSMTLDSRRFLVRTDDWYTSVYDFESGALLFRLHGLEKVDL